MSKLRTTAMILVTIFALSYIFSLFFDETEGLSGNVAILKIRGVLTVDRSPGFIIDYSSSTDIVKSIKDLDKNPSIKAIIFDINSPGGTPVATDEIAQAIKNSDKLTVALIRDIGASGGYWVASSCDTIISNRMSMVGSIGATASYLEFSGLMKRYNVSYERLVSGKHKDMGSPFRSLTDEERIIFQDTLESLETIFIDEVSVNRNLPKEKVKQLATGRVFLGIEAKEHGLVDTLGGMDESKIFIEEELNITVQPTYMVSEKSVFSDIFQFNSKVDDLGLMV